MNLLNPSTFFALFQYATTVASSSTRHNQQNQQPRGGVDYSTLPPTVFAPDGRLYGVERVAKEAFLLDTFDGDDDDVSCGVLALHCNRCTEINDSDNYYDGDDDNDGNKSGEFAVMVGIGPISPFLHRDEAYLKQQQQQPQQLTMNNDATTSDTVAMSNTYLPLTIDESITGNSHQSSTTTAPLSILSPTLIAGVGGKAIDSMILLRRTTEVALSMYASDNGGVDWFVSHSLEGMTGEKVSTLSSRPMIMGGAAGVDVTSLVRRVADMAQSSTQSLGGRYGRMLSSSLLAVGARNLNSGTLALWRVDPTGQFWRLDASAVGRRAIDVESELLRRAQTWRRMEHDDKEDQQHRKEDSLGYDSDILNGDVRSFLGSLSVEEAVEVATDCLVNGILESRKQHSNTKDQTVTIKQMEQGLRKRVQAVVIRSKNADGQSSRPCIEIV
ncbi:hypothetical protein ACHAXR_007613 [Thalassiosira sp. AJA248-18]